MNFADSILARGRIAKMLSTFAALFVAGALSAAEPDIRRDATVEAIERVMPSVVNIRTETIVANTDSYEDLFRQFFDPYYRRQPQAQYSLGSGVIIDEDGYILTNLHVVRRATRTQIKLSDEAGGGEYEVEPVLGTARADVALLKIIKKKPGEKFKAIQFAKDDDLLLGETVIALGNPFGLGGSVSRGILSSKRRAVPKENQPLELENWMQTDAAINPGNSGGPLVDLRGDLIGLNVAVLARAQGIGFAIPVKQVGEALTDIFRPETMANALWFGARFSLGGTPRVVTAVKPESPAEKAGLRVGDEILRVNGKTPRSFIELNDWLRDKTQRDFKFEISRGGQRQTIPVRLLPVEEMLRQKLGIDAQEINADLASNFGLSSGAGLLIAGVQKNSPAAQAQLGSGFVITQINGQRTPDLLNAAAMLEDLKKGDSAEVNLLVPRRRGNYLVGYSAGTVTLKVR